jgi:large conductance mechanosensitive channel
MINGFRDFVLRGNVVDLAVGVVTGAAFAALIVAFGVAFLNPLVKLVTGGGKVGGSFFVNGVEFPYGAFITAVITFLLTMTVIYWVSGNSCCSMMFCPHNSIFSTRKVLLFMVS